MIALDIILRLECFTVKFLDEAWMLKVAPSFGGKEGSKKTGFCRIFLCLRLFLPSEAQSSGRVLRSVIGGLKIGIRTGLKSHGNDLSHVGVLLTSSAINSSIGFKVALDAAVIIHDEVGILPMSA